MAKKVVRVRKKQSYDASGAPVNPPGQDAADDGAAFDPLQWTLAVTDGTPDPGAAYKAAVELTREVYGPDGNPVHYPGEQYSDSSAMSPDVRYRDVVVAVGATVPDWS